MVFTTQTNAFPVRCSSYEPVGGKSTLAHLFRLNYISILIIGKYDTMLKTAKNLEMAFYHTEIAFPARFSSYESVGGKSAPAHLFDFKSPQVS